MPISSVILWRTLVCLTLSGSCASREVPVRFPETSPAAPDARAATPAQVTRSVTADPGAPGDNAQHAGQTQDPAGHEGHHGHHH